jgi:hypothetical protein
MIKPKNLNEEDESSMLNFHKRKSIEKASSSSNELSDLIED